MTGIFITVYLAIGALASAFIWIILIASKRRQDKAKDMKRGRLESNLIHEPNTKSGRFQS